MPEGDAATRSLSTEVHAEKHIFAGSKIKEVVAFGQLTAQSAYEVMSKIKLVAFRLSHKTVVDDRNNGIRTLDVVQAEVICSIYD